MDGQVSIVGADGQPLRPSRASMLVGGTRTPYDAADLYGDAVADWNPYLWSPDGELNMYRDRIVSRVRDVVRNDGWASAAITRTLDTVIGADFRPIFKPDYQALNLYSGLKTFDHVWAEEYGSALDAKWRTWSNDPGRFCDAQRNLTVSQLMRVAFRHKIVDGDALAQLLWLPQNVAPGRGHYATTIQLIDPDRLSNPQLQFDQQTMRGGVKVDPLGAADGYYIRRAHQGDWFSAADSVHWDLIPRETAWGRPIIVHDYDHDRAGQHRGGNGILTPVLQRLKMLIKYDGVELDAAIINAIFGAYIESPFDQDFIEGALDDKDKLSAYQEGRSAFHKDRRIRLGGAQLTSLYPGETIGQVSAARPNPNFEAFESAALRNISAGTGLAPQQISQNWSDVNYSSYRAAMLEAWKTFHRRRHDFGYGFGQPIAVAFVEELHEVDELPMPAGAPDFIECRGAYARCKWMGPGRGYVDPVKEKQGAVMGMDAGLSTLEDEAAELSGADWRELADRRAVEMERYKKLGIPFPAWGDGTPANKASEPPPEAEPA